MKKLTLFFLMLFSANIALAKPLSIVTTTTDLAWVSKKIGGENVRVVSLLNGREDAHYLDAKPSFIRKVSNADIVCFNGLALELGWLPKVLSKSGNAKVQAGGKGHCDASQKVKVIEQIHGNVDRSMGDVHPEGNPHYTLSPEHIVQAAETVMSTMIAVDVKNAKFYVQNFQQLEKEMKVLKSQIQRKLEKSLGSLKDVKVLQYHKEFSYFLNTYGFTQAGALEPVPGVPPSAGRLAEVSVTAGAKGVKLALGASYSPRKLLKQFTRISKVPHVVLPVSIQKKGKTNTYKRLQAHLADEIIRALQK